MLKSVNVLNLGKIDLIHHTPNPELTIVNTARVSFAKTKEVMDKTDERLINYLIKWKHFSPIRHVMISFRVRLPIFVKNQFIKHQIGCNYGLEQHLDSAFNEISGRYVEFKEEFFSPDKFRKQSKDNKQATIDEEIDESDKAREIFNATISQSYEAYENLLKLGVGREIARTVLPLGLYTEFIWTASLQAVLNFISLRSSEHAQYEIRVYAQVMREMLSEIVPTVMKAWDENGY